MNPYLATLTSEPGFSCECLAERGLAPYAETADLQLAEYGRDGRPRLLAPPAAAAWRSLRQAAGNEGIELFIVSAFRSIARQEEIFRSKLAAGLSLDEILAVSAPPGYSEHHTGRAVDLSTPGCRSLTAEFEQTPAFAWLQARAGYFGFSLSFPRDNARGYIYEPWHWCFTTPAVPTA
jgi:D-alanyl-D-alanine carboxypeptidase